METTATTPNTITKQELSTLVKQGEASQVVNVLEPKYYNLGFIPGSKKIPVAELGARVNELDRSKEVIVYCGSVDCNASTKAAEKLTEMGFKARAYRGGLKEWKESGLPMEQELKVA